MRRGSGILCHVTSLPSPYGIGDLGPSAYRFVDFLGEAKQTYWQILPLSPTEPAYGNSPYHSTSAFAYNPLLISPELMLRDGLLAATDLEISIGSQEGRVNYDTVIAHRRRLFPLAYERFRKTGAKSDYERFCSENSRWLDDFALFVAVKEHLHGRAWPDWPLDTRERQPKALESMRTELRDRVEMEKFLQYLFFEQWLLLKRYCNERGIHIIGDIPIYVDHDSADLWTNPDIFELDDHKRPSVVAGVPPDYFSETGQLWGNPLYRWDVLSQRRYDFWVERIKHNLDLFDFVRLDHFRGFVAYWEVPATERTAINGRWVEAPGMDFFNQLTKRCRHLPIIAEDLGIITPEVREIMRQFGFPGMRVLLFAFGEHYPMHPYLPHTYERNCVVYTGTHDNNTLRGWYEREASAEDKRRLFDYLGREVRAESLHWELIRLAMMSVADVAVFPMQDVLGLGEEARMNRPGTSEGNWRWRITPNQIAPLLASKLGEMTEVYGRA